MLLKRLHQKEVGETQIGGRGHGLTPTDPAEIPVHMASWSAHRAQEKEKEKEGAVRVMVPVFPSHYHMRWSPAFLGMAEYLPAHGNN